MSSNIAQISPPSEPDDVVRATIRGLIGYVGLTEEQVALGVDIPKSTFAAKLKARGARRGFTAGELAAIAGYFGVPVGSLFDGLGGLMSPNEAAALRARQDSNLQPSDPRYDSPPARVIDIAHWHRPGPRPITRTAAAA